MSNFREACFEIDDRHGHVSESEEGWTARWGDTVAQDATPIGAILGLVPNENPTLILTDLWLRQDEAAANETHGVPFVEGTWIHLSELIADCGEDVTEHPDFTEWASVYGTEEFLGEESEGDADEEDSDEESEDDRPELYRVGGLRGLYFLLDVDGWTWRPLGWFDSPEEAAEAACDIGQDYEML